MNEWENQSCKLQDVLYWALNSVFLCAQFPNTPLSHPTSPFSPFIIFSAVWSTSFQHLCAQTCIMENLHHYATRFPSRALYCYPRSTCSNTIVCIFHGTRTVPNSRSCASCSRDVGVFGWLGGTWKSLDRLQCFLVGHPNEQLFH